MNQTCKLRVKGMTCPNCERRIETALSRITGVSYVKSDFNNGEVTIIGEMPHVSLQLISDTIAQLGYSVDKTGEIPASKWRGLIVVIAVLAAIMAAVLLIRNKASLDTGILSAGTNIGYGVLFIIGFVSSLHCVAMCGGINLSVCASYKTKYDGKSAKLLPSALYNAGRIASYTLIGGIVGSIGAVINISPNTRGVGAIIAGIFMLIMGLGMLDIPLFRKITPKMPKLFGNRLHSRLGSAAPFTIGLLNGLMPCGPLQSVQFYALGTGGFVPGALSMFMFSLGTAPLMFGLGAAGTLLSRNATRNMMKIGAIMVAGLGLFMLFMGMMSAVR